MCSITTHDKQQPAYADYERSGSVIEIPKNETTEALQSLGVTLNFIDFWLKIFHHNYQVLLILYNEVTIKFF